MQGKWAAVAVGLSSPCVQVAACNTTGPDTDACDLKRSKQMGINERMALFEKHGAPASPPAPVRKLPTVAGLQADVDSPQPRASIDATTASAALAAPQPVLSLKERMARLQGGGGDDEGATAQGAAPADSKSGASAASGGLQDRLKVFGNRSEAQSSAEPATSPANAELACERPPGQQQPEGQQQPDVSQHAPAAVPSSMSISERMAALQGSGDAAGAGKVTTKTPPVIGKLKQKRPPPPEEEAPAVENPPGMTTSAAVPSVLPLKERMALLQQQEKGDQQRAPASVPEGALSMKERMALLEQEKSCSDSQVREERAVTKLVSPAVNDNQNQSPQAEATREKSPEKQRKAHARYEGSHLSVQAREVAAALGGLQVDDEGEEEEVLDPNVPSRSVVGRVSMFETGDMAAGWDVERESARASLPGRLPGREQEVKIDNSALDVSGIKNRWKSGAVKAEDKTKKSASEDALFRCNVAASTRTGGVAEIQQRMKDLAEGKKPSPPPHKQQSKVAEIAEQIHFDPNTMLPGAQHPSLNYNATESSQRANEWRAFAQVLLSSI